MILDRGIDFAILQGKFVRPDLQTLLAIPWLVLCLRILHHAHMYVRHSGNQTEHGESILKSPASEFNTCRYTMIGRTSFNTLRLDFDYAKITVSLKYNCI